MKISITPISFSRLFRSGEMNIRKFIDYSVEHEMDGIDVLDFRCYPWFWNDKEKELKELPGMLEKSGLLLAAFATGNNFAHMDEAGRRENIEIVKNAVEEAAELHAPVLRIFGGNHCEAGGEEGIETDNGLQMIIDCIGECLPHAEKHGVVLALENHGKLPAHSYELKAVVEHFGSPFLKVMFDSANFMGNSMHEPENTLSAYERLSEHIVHVHVKDFGPAITTNLRKLEGYVAGKGIVPLRQLVARLEEDGYDGFCSLEYEASAITPEVHGVPASLEYLKKIRRIHNVLNNIK